MTKRTQEEILKRIEERKSEDPFGFEITDYVGYLDFQHSKDYLVEGTTEEQWKEIRAQTKPPRDVMIDYMSFAFGKAHGGRGISASRSISHMCAWSWLDSDELFAVIDMNDYPQYGLPILRKLCAALGINPKDHGDTGE